MLLQLGENVLQIPYLFICIKITFWGKIVLWNVPESTDFCLEQYENVYFHKALLPLDYVIRKGVTFDNIANTITTKFCKTDFQLPHVLLTALINSFDF